MVLLNKMKDINNYILEKLHLNKDTKPSYTFDDYLNFYTELHKWGKGIMLEYVKRETKKTYEYDGGDLGYISADHNKLILSVYYEATDDEKEIEIPYNSKELSDEYREDIYNYIIKHKDENDN